MDLKMIKPLLNWLPETYLIMSVIYYWVMTGTLLNPIAICLLVALMIFVLLKNRAMGIVISSVFLLLNLYMVLAMISELNQFPEFNNKALALLLFGSIYLGLNIFLSTRMLIKWTSKDDKSIIPN